MFSKLCYVMLLGLHFNKHELCMPLFISSFPDTTLLLIIRLIVCIVIILNVFVIYIYMCLDVLFS